MSNAASAAPTTRDVAILLNEIGTLLELSGGDGFRARAFARAARELEGVDADLGALAREDRLTELRGIGPGIASVISEYVVTGSSTAYEELRQATPVALYDLLRIPGLGPKRIHQLHEELSIENLDDLETAAKAGRIAALQGMGKRTEKKILDGLKFARTSRRQRRFPDALEAAERFLEWLREHEDVDTATLGGGLRRCSPVVDEIVLVAATEEPASVIADLHGIRGMHAVATEDDEVSFKLTDGMAVRIRCVEPDQYAGALVWETGNDAHLKELREFAEVRGFTLRREGLFRADELLPFSGEREFYEAVGLKLVPPELREGLGEIGAAAGGRLPQLVERDDLKGTFHCHTTFSDGKATLEEMADGAADRGWEYLGIADHSQTAAYAGGLPIARIRQQWREIDRWNDDRGDGRAYLFKGIESDILNDGRLDYPDRILAEFDYVVGSVHSAFGLGEEEMTRRMITAVRNPYLTMLGHPTGRLLLRREGYAVNIGEVLVAAAEHSVVIEINANPHRLDLDWREVRRAADLGVLIAINPDAHSVRALDHVGYGVNMARKAGLEADQIINTWPLEEVRRFLGSRKQSR